MSLLGRKGPLGRRLGRRVLGVSKIRRVLIAEGSTNFRTASRKVARRNAYSVVAGRGERLLTRTVMRKDVPSGGNVLLPCRCDNFSKGRGLKRAVRLSLKRGAVPMAVSNFCGLRGAVFTDKRNSVKISKPVVFLPRGLFRRLVPSMAGFSCS